MRNFINLVERAIDLNLDGLDMTDAEAFVQSLKRVPREQVVTLNDEFKRRRDAHANQYAHMTKLYHGAPEQAYDDGKKGMGVHAEIMANGFKLTKGKRSIGGMGATEVVDNLGIFLTDSPQLANYFGNNRDFYGRGRVITCWVDTRNMFVAASAKGELVKLGVRLLNDYNGTTKKSLAVKDWWWLVDKPEFVNMIKRMGHSGIIFQETTEVRRSANALKGHTYFIFDPRDVHIERPYTIETFFDEIKAGR